MSEKFAFDTIHEKLFDISNKIMMGPWLFLLLNSNQFSLIPLGVPYNGILPREYLQTSTHCPLLPLLASGRILNYSICSQPDLVRFPYNTSWNCYVSSLWPLSKRRKSYTKSSLRTSVILTVRPYFTHIGKSYNGNSLFYLKEYLVVAEKFNA